MLVALVFLRFYTNWALGLCLCLVSTLFAHDITYNACAQKMPHMKLHRQTLIACAHKCYCFDRCSYFGYDTKMALCDIYESQPDTHDQKCPGYSLISKSSTKAIVKRTNHQDCSLYETNFCRNISGDTGLLGNTNVIGSKRTVICQPNHDIDGPRITTCMQSGKWSDHGTCKKVCQMFELTNIYLDATQIEINTSAGTFVFDSTNDISKPLFVGSRVSLTCVNGTILSGKETMECVGGIWSAFPTCKGSMRKPCQTDSECTDTESECRNKQCWCKRGLSYDPCRFSCVAVCPGFYGDTFQILDNYAIEGYNKMKQIVSSGEACKSLCHLSQDYVCKYAEFRREKNLCKLNEIPEGAPPKVTYNNQNIFYQRDCSACET